jgi:hypothetical protein
MEVQPWGKHRGKWGGALDETVRRNRAIFPAARRSDSDQLGPGIPEMEMPAEAGISRAPGAAYGTEQLPESLRT